MEQYGGIIAAFINSVLVLAIVQLLKIKIPVLREKLPWLIPIIAGAIGPAVAAGQNYLSQLLGVAIDLNPIAAIFTGGTAVAIHQVGKQASKEAAKQIAILLMIGALAFSAAGCASFESNTYKTMFTLGTAYDAAMKSAAELYNQEKISYEQAVKIIELGNLYYVAYQEACIAFEIYKKTQSSADKEKLITALAEVSKRYGEIISYIEQLKSAPNK